MDDKATKLIESIRKKSEEMKDHLSKGQNLTDFVEAAAAGQEWQKCPLKKDDIAEILRFLFPRQKPLKNRSGREFKLDENQYILVDWDNDKIFLDDKHISGNLTFVSKEAIQTMMMMTAMWIDQKKGKTAESFFKNYKGRDRSEQEGINFLANLLNEKRKISERIRNVRDSLNTVKNSIEFDHGNILVFLKFLDAFSMVDTYPRIKSSTEDHGNLAWIKKEYFKSFMSGTQYNVILNLRNHVLKNNQHVIIRPQDFTEFIDDSDNSSIESFFTTLHEYTAEYVECIEGRKSKNSRSLPLRNVLHLPETLLGRFSRNLKNLNKEISSKEKRESVIQQITHELTFDLILNVYPRMAEAENRMEIKTRISQFRNRLVHSPLEMTVEEIKEQMTCALPSMYKYSLASKLNTCLSEVTETTTIDSIETKLSEDLQKVNKQFHAFKVLLDNSKGEGFNKLYEGTSPILQKKSQDETNEMLRYLKYMAPLFDSNLMDSHNDDDDVDQSSTVQAHGPLMRAVYNAFVEWEEAKESTMKSEKLQNITLELAPLFLNFDVRALVSQICQPDNERYRESVSQLLNVLSALRSLRSLKELEKVEISEETLSLMYETAIDSKLKFCFDHHKVLNQKLQLNQQQKRVVEDRLNEIKNSSMDTFDLPFGSNKICINVQSAVRNYMNTCRKEYNYFTVTFNSWPELFSDDAFWSYARSLKGFEKNLGNSLVSLQRFPPEFTAPLFAMYVMSPQSKSSNLSHLSVETVKILLSKESYKQIFINLLLKTPEAIIDSLSTLETVRNLSVENFSTILKHVDEEFIKKWINKVNKNYSLVSFERNGESEERMNLEFSDTITRLNEAANAVFLEHVLGGNERHGLEFNEVVEAGLVKSVKVMKITDDGFQAAERCLIKAKARNALGSKLLREAKKTENKDDLRQILEESEAHVKEALNVLDTVADDQLAHFVLSRSRKAYSNSLLWTARTIYAQRLASSYNEKKKYRDEMKTYMEEQLTLCEEALSRFQKENKLKDLIEKSTEFRKYLNGACLRREYVKALRTLLTQKVCFMGELSSKAHESYQHIIKASYEVYKELKRNAATDTEKAKLPAARRQIALSHVHYAMYLKKTTPLPALKILGLYHSCQALKSNILAFESEEKSVGFIIAVLNSITIPYIIKCHDHVKNGIKLLTEQNY